MNDDDNSNDIERCNSRLVAICTVNCFQYLCSSGQGAIMCKSCATHWAFIVCNILCTTWYKGTAEPVGLTEMKLHLFLLNFIGLHHSQMQERRKSEYSGKTPDDQLQKMPHTKS